MYGCKTTIFFNNMVLNAHPASLESSVSIAGDPPTDSSGVNKSAFLRQIEANSNVATGITAESELQ